MSKPRNMMVRLKAIGQTAIDPLKDAASDVKAAYSDNVEATSVETTQDRIARYARKLVELCDDANAGLNEIVTKAVNEHETRKAEQRQAEIEAEAKRLVKQEEIAAEARKLAIERLAEKESTSNSTVSSVA